MADLRKLVSIKEAAELTGYSIPYFYTASTKKALNYDPKARPFLIQVGKLVELGLLDGEGNPASDRNAEARSWKKTIDDLKARIHPLEQQVAELNQLLSEKDAQIAILKEIMVATGKAEK